MGIAISAENIGKRYQLGKTGTGTVSHDLNRWFARMRGKPDPFLKVGEGPFQEKPDYIWALKGVDLEVRSGDVLGVIGKNGAGKSTLLKIFSRTTAPTTGIFKVKGRMASLLEVGTGFHPELTGLENIYLNGAVLGMTRSEIKSKLDEIISFSGVEKFIGTPVKRYSSGMYVRLAFAVAAHLEPEILIVDEVLAVGDAEFQKKCLGKMKDASFKGRTVIFVSHNMTAVRSLCDKAVLIESGMLKSSGSASDVVTNYIHSDELNVLEKKYHPDSATFATQRALLISARLIKTEGDEFLTIATPFRVDIEFELYEACESFYAGFHVNTIYNECVFITVAKPRPMGKGKHRCSCLFPAHLFNNKSYKLALYLVKNRNDVLLLDENLFVFEVQDVERNPGEYLDPYDGNVRPQLEWSME